MTYELANELKDAGFPKEIILPDTVECVTVEEDGSRTDGATTPMAEYPTLSELIEACGDGYFFLERSQVGWFAKMTPRNSMKEDLPFAWGDTPEEAVGLLWLKLNTK